MPDPLGTATVLVTGAAGHLGRVLVPELAARGLAVRAMSRDAERAAALTDSGVAGAPAVTGVVADLLVPATLRPALVGVTHVLHLASSPRDEAYRIEVEGTRQLLLARDSVAPDALVTYVSIVGCDRTPMAYYRAKTDAEAVVRAAPRTAVVRATQFHSFIRTFVKVLPALGRATVPRGARFQPVDIGDVARLLAGVADGPLPAEVAGPEELTLAEIARRVTGRGAVQVPAPGRLARAIRSGTLLPGPDAHLCPTPFPTTAPTPTA